MIVRHKGNATCSPQAAKQRRYRQRKNGGKICLKIFVDSDDVQIALQGVGALPPTMEHSRKAIEAALQEHLSDWLAAWAQHGNGG